MATRTKSPSRLEFSPDVARATSVKDALEKMPALVQEGRWCRNVQFGCDPDTGIEVYCALGLMEKVGASAWGSTIGAELTNTLLAAIPDDEMEWCLSQQEGNRVNGGIVRQFSAVASDTILRYFKCGGRAALEGRLRKPGLIATYNNTRYSRRDIIAWFRRALASV